jgi:hypothetical protein
MKSKTIIKKIIFILLIILAKSCKETVIEYRDVIKIKEGYVKLSSNEVEIGQKITAQFVNFDMDSSFVYTVTFDLKPVAFTQQNDSTLTLIVPYTGGGNMSGSFVIYCMLYSESSSDTVLVSDKIHYLYDPWPNDPYMKWNTGEEIIKSDSYKMDDGREKKYWTSETIQDTIKFIRHVICHDECYYGETLVFKNLGNNILPEFLYAIYVKDEWMFPPIHERIENRCKIIINEWSDSTNFSGTFSAPDYSWAFWYNQ